MNAYWLYCRLDVHVALPYGELMDALDAYADEHVIGGKGELTEDHRRLIKDQHDQAFLLYGAVMGGFA